MPTLSGLKDSVRSVLRNPHDAYKPRPKKRTISFNEALENLKNSRNGCVTCAAFHSFGKCRKEIYLSDSNFLANLNQMNMSDIQTPLKLMPLMLCSSHWKKSIYHNTLFLDWLFVYGSKQDNQHYESIVIDYQSAIAIDEEDNSPSEDPVPDKSTIGDQGRLGPIFRSPVTGRLHLLTSRTKPEDDIVYSLHSNYKLSILIL